MKLREKCGVAGVFSADGKPIAQLLYASLIALQHRGQDAAGMVLSDGGLQEKKGFGLVAEAFSKKDLESSAAVGVGHTRYPTTSTYTENDIQPSAYKNVAIANNGHIANYEDVKGKLAGSGYEFRGGVESELMAYFISGQLSCGRALDEAVTELMKTLDGAYSTVGIVDGKLFCFRDPHAIRPLVLGKKDDAYFVASESVAFDISGAEYIGPVKGGELIVFEKDGPVRKQLVPEEPRHCMFEYVYFSRPDSIIDDQWVFRVREKIGEIVAREAPVKADIVVPVPDTSRSAAMVMARELNARYEEGIIKNRYVGRTFIMPDQQTRVEAVRRKLNPVKPVVDGKVVVLVDDSIVRGTTMREMVKMMRAAGAKEVHLRITCPPITHPCFYGVNIPTFGELIAGTRGIDEIKEYLEVDSLHYLSMEGLKEAVGRPLCTGCLDGGYPTEYAKKLSEERRDDSGGCCG